MASLVALAYALVNRRPRTSSSSSSPSIHYEFGGPIGAATLLIALPGVIAGLYFSCNGADDDQCVVNVGGLINSLRFILSNVTNYPLVRAFALQHLLSIESFVIVTSWILLHAILYYVLPGDVVDGVELQPLNGDKVTTKLSYPLNGLLSMYVSVGIVVALCYFDIVSPTIGYDQFSQLAFASTVISIVLSFYLYASSLYSSRDGGRYLTTSTQLAPHGATGHVLYDFFIGRTLNPRILNGSFDLKYFCELRPGLIGWVLINASMIAKQYQINSSITNSIVLVNLFQTWYVYDALSSERAILTTMDITTDGFGWMLAFGDLAWVPFTYSTQSRYLVDHALSLSPAYVLLVLAVQALGFWIFRGSNSQKNDFRTNPSSPGVAHLKYISTKSGSRLLISGWWGYSRHMNYFGDLLMGLAWCMTCGYDSVIPYFYVCYFAGLLIHREMRDEEKCRNKYGEDWTRYCSIVKAKIIPYVY